jgi:carbonic anhydrase/acetyltransferase-like protein (isoleucine patch superfamily)
LLHLSTCKQSLSMKIITFDKTKSMALIKPCRGKEPKMGNFCWFAENATIVGDVAMGDESSVWFSAVIRGDVNYIVIGNKVNVQDGAVIHCIFEKTKTILGNNVSIGHNALVHGCTVEDNVLIKSFA